MKKALIFVVILLIASMVANVLLWRQSQLEEHREIYIDTIPYRTPIPVDSFVIRYVTEKLPIAPDPCASTDITTIDTLVTKIESPCKDSVEVAIPITQKVYEDSTYRAYVSGFHPALDSIFITQRKEVIYIRSPTKRKRWSVGIQVGAGITPSRVEPYLGVGISYNIFTF